MEINNLFDGVFKNRRVLVTGHTGFKGSWLCLILNKLGAEVYGYALDPPTSPSLFEEAGIGKIITSHIGDIRDYKNLVSVIQKVNPEIVIHMAAQATVLESYRDPVETYSVNVMGTVNLLEAIRNTPGVKSVVNVTSDKCYENRELQRGYCEDDPMGGYDPYSNSKGCSELVTSAFRSSFFNAKDFAKHGLALASARAGNVIGGGDWADDRLIPDFIRAILKGEKVKIRCPYAVRPWQHVLEPLTGYLTLAAALFKEGPEFADAWNFGPDDADAKNVEWIIKTICTLWGDDASYEVDANPKHHEATYLKLDCSKAKAKLNWDPKWDIYKSLVSIVEWNKARLDKQNIQDICNSQIDDYFYNSK